MPLLYITGEDIQEGDKILYDGLSGEVEVVADPAFPKGETDELPMPAEQRVRRDDQLRKLAQRRTAQSIGPRGKFPSIVIGEPEAPPTHLLPQDPILFDQIRQHLPLPPVQSGGNSEQQHLEGRDVDRVRELTSLSRSGMASQRGRGVEHYGHSSSNRSPAR